MTKWLKAGLVCCSLLLSIVFAEAKVGVGVGTGTIRLDEPLKPGGIYTLPPLVVFNTGTEESEYRVSIAFHADNHELRPDLDWFHFSPETFVLEPGESKNVRVTLSVPFGASPGDYFNFLEAFPHITQESGITTLGVAAASRFYFTVVPSSKFQALTLRLVSFVGRTSPWSYIVFATVAAAILLLILRRFVSFNVSLRRRPRRRWQ